MVTLAQLEEQIMALPDGDRADLALSLLKSLPAAYVDDDDGLAEALRRDAEMDADPSVVLTFEDFKRAVGR